MSIEHPYLRGWFPLQDGRNINVNQIVWFRNTIKDGQNEPAMELILSNGITITLDDPVDREAFGKLVGTLDETPA